MLRYYLEEGQPDLTDRLVRGQPAAEETRIERLKETMQSIERIIKEPDNTQSSSFQGETTVVGTSGRHCVCPGW